MEFWNSQLTEKSWNLLQEIRKKYNFILIGGWAVYLWTKQQKSKDIDIAVSIEELQKLKQESLIKNDRLKRYEIKYGDIDVDIYVSHFSKLTLPVEELTKYVSETEGFKVASKEALLALKQGAETDRSNSVKGEKDRIDIISLLLFSNFDFKFYAKIINKYSKAGYIEGLVSLLKSFKDYNSLNLTPREFKLKKCKILNELRRL
jgi:hypothetical protein